MRPTCAFPLRPTAGRAATKENECALWEDRLAGRRTRDRCRGARYFNKRLGEGCAVPQCSGPAPKTDCKPWSNRRAALIGANCGRRGPGGGRSARRGRAPSRGARHGDFIWRPPRRVGTRIVGWADIRDREASRDRRPYRVRGGLGHEEGFLRSSCAARDLHARRRRVRRPRRDVPARRRPLGVRRAVAAEPGTASSPSGGPPVFSPSDSEWIEGARAPTSARTRACAAIEILEECERSSRGPVGRSLRRSTALARGDGPRGAPHPRGVLVGARLRPVLADDADLEPRL